MPSEIRQDVTSGEWVIISAQRANRPFMNPRAKHSGADEAPGTAAECPFCPHHEAETPKASFVLPSDASPEAWQVRVFSNKFPALFPDLELRPPTPELFPSLPGFGFHEVIVETPQHNKDLAEFSQGEIELVLRAYLVRTRRWAADPRVKMVIAFRNHGARSGATIPHPHSQILALPVVPTSLQHRLDCAEKYNIRHERNLYTDLIEKERRDGSRVVADTDDFLVAVPYAPRSSFEIWILPKKAAPTFTEISEGEISSFAATLLDALQRMKRALEKPHYNFVLYTAPTDDTRHPGFSWHVKIFPRLISFAGFEIGSGMGILSVTPEDMAAALRKAG